jgi:hypothetical protein
MRVGQFILGEDVGQFEREFARRCHQDYCVGVSNGTAGSYLALRAFGVGPGEEVITSAMSRVATGNSITALSSLMDSTRPPQHSPSSCCHAGRSNSDSRTKPPREDPHSCRESA